MRDIRQDFLPIDKKNIIIMKTILVIYTTTKITDAKSLRQSKHYAFNTDSDISEGDMLDSKEYSSYMQVVKVLDKNYKYYNNSTGELSDNFNSTSQREIANLEIRNDNNNIVYASKVEAKTQ